MKGSGVLACLLLSVGALGGLDLSLSPDDLLVEQALEGGYHLWIRKKPDIASVLLTESTEDPARKVASYAFRTTEYNPVNGDERRILDGEFLDTSRGYHLVDSTPESHPVFGEAFHIFIPYVVIYGYPWSRSGELLVVDGTYLNVRTFEKPYADYTGAFQDNPFILRVIQKPFEGPPEENYMPAAVESFTRLAEESRTPLLYSTGQEDVLKRIEEVLSEREGDTLDLVVVLDTTQSMEDDIPYVKRELGPLVRRVCAPYRSVRIGVVLYKDYMEEYLNKVIPFESDMGEFQRLVQGIRVSGGRDLPEAVHEALYAALVRFDWQAEDRKIILVGDAPPHPRPRGAVTEEMVRREAERKKVRIYPVLLPQ
ncbi:hypothetical protein Spith_0174 [Spirochaeta thermophila DSM 6578]|uniref:VWFA domain-containing protein n=1 Tax=Winmispira thermophila (strain ATCC 700085 / DSM 6578 / Z-1203) TaxID=869211 RepID=G0GCP2_WINT7|nr:vWA domain-containing protein [Spirochaeta thermophila]AEJ60461.1 hypothetical protein Spith_0174 [Spirochaeta thermophila DSM 6578]